MTCRGDSGLVAIFLSFVNCPDHEACNTVFRIFILPLFTKCICREQ
jgi:hypothetical protein